MRHTLHALLLAAALTLSGGVATAVAADVRTGYAMSDTEAFGKGIYSFELGDTLDNLKLLQPLTVEGISGGYLVDNLYYYLEYQQVMQGYKVLGLYSYDMDTKSTRQIADYGAQLQGTIAGNFAYDYQTKTMYGLNGFNGGYDLMKVDLETGKLTDQGQLTFDGVPEVAKQPGSMGEHLHVLACSYDGDMYGVGYWGGLYKVNPYTLVCQYIGTLDYNPGQAFMYTSDCLFYDNNTDELFLRFTYYNWDTRTWGYELVKIDPKTAHVTRFANVPPHSSLNAITVPFTVASASAPAKVSDLKITRGSEGSLTATLEWTNPSKTYGRGGTLEELSYVLVYRDGALVDSLVNPVIGGHQTWTDNNIGQRGYYTYKVVPGNSVGRGDRASTGTYIGKGDPLGVTDLKLAQNGDGAALSWTAPSEGKLGSYIDTSSLTYDVVRKQNSSAVAVKVAAGVKETSWSETSLPDMANYNYGVVPHTDNAVGDTVWSGKMVLGKAYDTPHTFAFDSQDDFNLWTTIDANGNYFTWEWSQGYYGTLKGAAVSYNYDGVIAADWLISPRVRLEAGQHYKLTFDAQPGSKKVPETLAISMGQGTDIASQDSVTQFVIVSDQTVALRANLPVVKTTGDYNLGLYYRSNVVNYKLSVGNIAVAEDHEGYITGQVSADGKPVAGAQVIAAGGQFTATTDEEGMYKLNYLPAGDYDVQVIALGYEDATKKAAVSELETTDCDIALTALPVYKVTGRVADVAGDPVAGAKVELSGYDSRETTTAADGSFVFSGVYRNANYAVSVSKNKLLEATKNFGVEADTDLGTLSMADNQKPAGAVSVKAGAASAEVTWKAPANDAAEQRIDDGTVTTSVGISNATANTMFGVVKREPQTISGVKFYIDGTASITHYSVRLNIFDLDADGNPTGRLLYQNTYVSAKDGQWNTYTLPAPVDAPNGYYMALSYDGYLLVGIDGNGDAQKYPFVKGVNCFTKDYTTGVYNYLDGQQAAYQHNFLIRPVAAPYTVPEDSTEFTAKSHVPFMPARIATGGDGTVLDAKDYKGKAPALSEPAVLKTPQSRLRYNVYRIHTADAADESKWTLLSESQQARSFTDNEWAQLAQGTYTYAVKALYTGGTLTAPSLSDSVGNKMLTRVVYNIATATPDPEAYGARVMLADGIHLYTATAGDDGRVELDSVWKGHYNVSVVLDGFVSFTSEIDIPTEDTYTFNCTLEEDRRQPKNLIIGKTGRDDERLFIWNYPDLFADDFEGHPDFIINSPGEIGWQYIDGDGAETGLFRNYEWDNSGKPMAYMVWNPRATTPSMYDDMPNMRAHSGDKCLSDWAAYNKQNDDWIITPKLYFNNDFKFSFYASSTDSYNPEAFEVAYSVTDAQPESFTVVADSTVVPAAWTQYTYDIPKEAKYVAIRCISDQKRIFLLDDIRYGMAEAMNVPAAIARPAAPVRRSPSLDGLYEIYLDGKKVAQQDASTYVFTSLTAGKHTAGVLASYTSGKTEMSTIDFSVDLSGIATVTGNGITVKADGRSIIVNGAYDSVELYGADGRRIPLAENAPGQFAAPATVAGTGILKIHAGSKTTTVKVRL